MPENYHDCQQRLSYFRALFENETIEKTGQNLKYDIAVLKWYDIDVKGPLFDTMIAHYLLEPDQRHNMDFWQKLTSIIVLFQLKALSEKKGKNQGSMREIDVEKVKEYAAEDADITLQLRQKLEPELTNQGVRKIFDEIEMPLVRVLADMEAQGVKLDGENLQEISKTMATEIAELEKQIYDLAETTFNIASPKQLGEILFDRLGLSDKAKKTKTGQYSTSEDVLQKLQHLHPIIPLILDFRSLSKLKSTYIDSLPTLINPRDGRIHTSYNQAVAATGRLSSNKPNLQNIPIRTARGREIRKAFVPRSKEYTLLAADYSQIELRIIAHLSKDEAMIAAFNEGWIFTRPQQPRFMALAWMR